MLQAGPLNYLDKAVLVSGAMGAGENQFDQDSVHSELQWHQAIQPHPNYFGKMTYIVNANHPELSDQELNQGGLNGTSLIHNPYTKEVYILCIWGSCIYVVEVKIFRERIHMHVVLKYNN